MVVVVVVAAGAIAPSAAGAVVASAAGAIAPSAAGAATIVVSVVTVVEVASVPAGVSTVVVSVDFDFDSHDVRPAVRARPKAAILNRLFILG